MAGAKISERRSIARGERNLLKTAWNLPARRIDNLNPSPHRASMISEKPGPVSGNRVPVFAVSCWALGLLAFTQLLVAGMALATRFEDSKEVRTVIKEVPKLVAVRVPATVAEPKSSPIVSRPPPSAPVESSQPLPPPTPIVTPKVDDPRAERLVTEARQARVKGDMGMAIMKLEEALLKSPEDPTIHYELGLVHEQMGVFDVAAAHYEKVFLLGATGAGALYQLASEKIGQGFDQQDAMMGKLALGRVRAFKAPENEEGQSVVLTIPVQKAPGEDIEVDQIAVMVSFFNRTSKGEIIELEDKSWVTQEWVTLPFDWAGGEENLRMTYVIPPQDIQTEHLFGERTYYGQVVTLSYKGEILDIQASPRALAAKLQKQPPAEPEGGLPGFNDPMPSDFDPNLLLPPILPGK